VTKKGKEERNYPIIIRRGQKKTWNLAGGKAYIQLDGGFTIRTQCVKWKIYHFAQQNREKGGGKGEQTSCIELNPFEYEQIHDGLEDDREVQKETICASKTRK